MTDQYNSNYYKEDRDPVKIARELTSSRKDYWDRQRSKQEQYWEEVHPREAASHYENSFSSAVQDFFATIFEVEDDEDIEDVLDRLALGEESLPDTLPDPMGEASRRFVDELQEATSNSLKDGQIHKIPKEISNEVLHGWLLEFFVFSERHQDWPHTGGTILEEIASSPEGTPIEYFDVDYLHGLVDSNEATNHTYRILSRLVPEAQGEFIDDLADDLEIELAQSYKNRQFDIRLLSLVEIFRSFAREYPEVIVRNHTDGIRQLIRIGGDPDIHIETRVQALRTLASLAQDTRLARELIRSETAEIRSALQSEELRIARAACDVITRSGNSSDTLQRSIEELRQSTDIDTVLAARRALETLNGNADTAESLVDFEMEQSVSELFKQLGERNPLIRIHAAQAIKNKDDAMVISEITSTLDDPDGDVRGCLCEALLNSDLESAGPDQLEKIVSILYTKIESSYAREVSRSKHLDVLFEVLTISIETIVDAIDDSPSKLFKTLDLSDTEEGIRSAVGIFANYSQEYIRRVDQNERRLVAKQVFDLFDETLSLPTIDDWCRSSLLRCVSIIGGLDGVPWELSERLFEHAAASAEIEPTDRLTKESVERHAAQAPAAVVLAMIAISMSDNTIPPTVYKAFAHTRHIYEDHIETNKRSESKEPEERLLTNALLELFTAVEIIAMGDEFEIPQGTLDTLTRSVNDDNENVATAAINILGEINDNEANRCLQQISEDPDRTVKIRRAASRALSD